MLKFNLNVFCIFRIDYVRYIWIVQYKTRNIKYLFQDSYKFCYLKYFFYLTMFWNDRFSIQTIRIIFQISSNSIEEKNCHKKLSKISSSSWAYLPLNLRFSYYVYGFKPWFKMRLNVDNCVLRRWPKTLNWHCKKLRIGHSLGLNGPTNSHNTAFHKIFFQI